MKHPKFKLGDKVEKNPNSTWLNLNKNTAYVISKVNNDSGYITYNLLGNHYVNVSEKNLIRYKHTNMLYKLLAFFRGLFL